jgi:cob(I)alamin adenosyltransferase
MAVHITTKRGDGGETSALSGDRVAKDHILIECSGCVDEFRAQLAKLRLCVLASGRNDDDPVARGIHWLMNACFLVGAQCSDPETKKPRWSGRHVEPRHVAALEAMQAALEEGLDMPACFIAGASTMEAAEADLACTAARRLERAAVRLAGAYPGMRDAPMFAFLNRASDYLFLVARTLDAGRHLPVDYGMVDSDPENRQIGGV